MFLWQQHQADHFWKVSLFPAFQGNCGFELIILTKKHLLQRLPKNFPRIRKQPPLLCPCVIVGGSVNRLSFLSSCSARLECWKHCSSGKAANSSAKQRRETPDSLLICLFAQKDPMVDQQKTVQPQKWFHCLSLGPGHSCFFFCFVSDRNALLLSMQRRKRSVFVRVFDSTILTVAKQNTSHSNPTLE